jgi:uncharacterized repeat protein (TIGR01451 family)
MRAFKWTAALAVLGLSSSLFAVAADNITVTHYESLQKLNIQSASIGMSQKLRGAGPVNLSFDALGRTFDLQLEPNSGLLSAASRTALAGSVEVYRGQLAGVPDSWTRIVMFDGMPRGLVWDGEQLFAIEAPDDSALPSNSSVIYRLADTFIAPGTMSCGVESASHNGAAMFAKLSGEIGTAMAQGPGAVSNMDIGAVGDFEFTTAKGGDAPAAAAIVTRLNNVDGIFSQQLGVQLTIQTLETFSDAADPFSDTLDASTLLGDVAIYRQGDPAQASQGLTHLYTGRDLAGPTVGIAYSGVPTGGVLCDPGFGAGLSEGNVDPTFDSLVAAHEIGHNFGAPHDGQAGSVCEAEIQPFIMATTLNGSTQFSACSIAQMQVEIALAGCIVPLPSVDLTIAVAAQPPTALLGNSATLTFNVDNLGTLLATNVAVLITLPGNVSFVSVAASTGSCINGGGIVTCLLGDVPGLSGRTVTLSTLATTLGTGDFNASVTADIDDVADNNQQVVQLTVDPAVDLAINTPAAATIELSQSTTVTALLENLSGMDATGVTLSISLSNGLQANSASWSLGNCTVTAQQVDCQSNSFVAQSSSSFDINVTGVTAGTRSYTATLASTEADSNTADNSITGTVRVNGPGGSDEDDSGGGSVGLAFLAFLCCAMLWTRRRSLLRQLLQM